MMVEEDSLGGRILIVEDDNDIVDVLRRTLRAEGYEVRSGGDGPQGLEIASEFMPDLVVLDLGLPGMDGLEVCTKLREDSEVPILMLTARADTEDRVTGLDSGADDYLVKPFGSGELSARVRAQLRRHQQQTPAGEPLITFGDIRIDLVRRVVERAGEELHLTPIEYKLLTHLASQPDRVITHAQLLKAVWGPGHQEDMHYVRVHMANLRKKVEDQPSMPRHLITETGVGYRFKC